MENNSRIWTLLKNSNNADAPSRTGIPLPGVRKPIDLRGVYKPGNHGLTVRKDTVEKWKISGLENLDGIDYLTGPEVKGKTLFELITEKALTAGHLEKLLSSIKVLVRMSPEISNETFGKLSSLGTFFADDGSMVFLSEELIRGILPLQDISCRQWEDALYNPAVQGPDNLLFGWSVLAYFLFTGSLPFSTDDEDRELKTTRGHFPPIALIMPELDPSLADFINRGLANPSISEIESGHTLFENLLNGPGFTRNISPEEAETRKAEAGREYRKAELNFSGKKFIRKKGLFALIVAGVAVIAGGILFTILSGFFAPPPTRGLEQTEVAELFFNGINELNVEIVDGCLTGRAGKDRLNMVTNLFAISRVRMGYEMNNPYIDAATWMSREDRSLNENEFIFGITDLKISETGENRGSC